MQFDPAVPSRLAPLAPSPPAQRPTPEAAAAAYRRIRQFSALISGFLEPEDHVVQSMPDVSPTRWHLAHTTWFFETFVLRQLLRGYRSPNERFEYLFNSYYNTLGAQFPRHRRGLLSRPTVAEVWQYRRHVDAAIEQLLDGGELDEEAWKQASPVFQLGLQHEQQHQELMLTDIKHVFSCNPLYPAFDPSTAEGEPVEEQSGNEAARPLDPTSHEGGMVEIGYAGDGFAYDNESPRHRVWLEPFELASAVVANGEFMEFIDAGGYRNPLFWLSEGWATAQAEDWQAPLYWVRRDDQWFEFTLGGLRPLRLDEPVCHVSFYEADAYARWANGRLPSEAEWEAVAAEAWACEAAHGTLADSAQWHPRPPRPAPQRTDSPRSDDRSATNRTPPRQLFGDVWEWTASPYIGYPGYRPAPGAIGEYNGKFMCNQFVLRGGSVATSRDHLRPTYRNFFPPAARWQFSGIRLAR